MGASARAGLLLAMVALLVAGQLVEREFAARRKRHKEVRAAANTYAELLKPLPDAQLPAPPAAAAAALRAGAGAANAVSQAAESLYVVQQGDTLARIARRAYGSEGAWKVIYDRNRASILDPARLQVGTSLQIPRRERPAGRRGR